jgi:hypothetical protein
MLGSDSDDEYAVSVSGVVITAPTVRSWSMEAWLAFGAARGSPMSTAGPVRRNGPVAQTKGTDSCQR